MRRVNKCVGKRKYPYRNIAIEMAHWKYIHENIILGVYECPTCLDFHLTSKYSNLKHLHKKWEAGRNSYPFSREDIKKIIKKQRKKIKKKKINSLEQKKERAMKKREA